MTFAPLNRKVLLALSGQTLVSASTYLAAKRAVQEWAPANVVSLRLTFSALAFGLVLLLAKGTKIPPKSAWPKVLFFGFLVGPLNQAALLFGISKSTTSHAALLYALTPLGVYAISLATRREKGAWHRLLGMLIALVGVVVLLLGRGLQEAMAPLWGDAIILIAVAAWVLYTTEGRSFVAEHGPIKTTAWSMISAALWVLPAAPWLFDFQAWVNGSFWAHVSLGFLVLFSSVVSYLLWYYALARVPASRVSAFTNLQPVVTALLAWLILGEALTWEIFLGGAFVVLGVWLTQKAQWPFSRPDFLRPRGIPFRQLLVRVRKRMAQEAVSDRAAQVSFFVLLALFPFLFFLTALAAYLPITGNVDNWLIRLESVMPREAAEVVLSHVRDLLTRTRPNFLTFSAAFTLWTASRGIDAFRKSLNHAYQVRERRPFWKTQGLALMLTLAGVVLSLLAVTLIVLGGRVGAFFAHAIWGADAKFSSFWAVLRWPLAALAMMALMSVYYYALPCVRQKYRHVLPGALLASVAWLAATFGFTRYVAGFGQFNATYGSIGGVIVLLLWIYVSVWVFIVGGEWNASLDKLAREKADPHARTS